MYALQLNGSIRVGIDRDNVVEPVSVTLYDRFATAEDAELVKSRIVASKVSSKSAASIKIVEV